MQPTIKNNRMRLMGYGVIAVAAIGACAFAVVSLIRKPMSFADIMISPTFENIPAGLIVTEVTPRKIEVAISGSPKRVEAFFDTNPVCLLDLSNASVGIMRFRISRGQVVLKGKGISIKRIEPDQVIVRIEKEMKRALPVTIRLTGMPADGFEVTRVSALPAEVLIRGPESRMEALTDVETKMVDISGANKRLKKEIPLNLPDGLALMSVSKVIAADVEIDEKTAIRTIGDVPISIRNTDHAYLVTPETVTLKIRGKQTRLLEVDPVRDIDVYFDLDGLKPGIYARRATIRIPVDTVLVSAHPEVFTVLIKEE